MEKPRIRYIGDIAKCRQWEGYALKHYNSLPDKISKVLRPDPNVEIRINKFFKTLEIRAFEEEFINQTRYIYVDTDLKTYQSLGITIVHEDATIETVYLPLAEWDSEKQLLVPVYGYFCCARFDVSNPDRVVFLVVSYENGSEDDVIYDYVKDTHGNPHKYTKYAKHINWSNATYILYEVYIKRNNQGNLYLTSPIEIDKREFQVEYSSLIQENLNVGWSHIGIYSSDRNTYSRYTRDIQVRDIYVNGDTIKILAIEDEVQRDALYVSSSLYAWAAHIPPSKAVEHARKHIYFGSLSTLGSIPYETFQERHFEYAPCPLMLIDGWYSFDNGAPYGTDTYLSYDVSGGYFKEPHVILSEEDFLYVYCPATFRTREIKCYLVNLWATLVFTPDPVAEYDAYYNPDNGEFYPQEPIEIKSEKYGTLYEVDDTVYDYEFYDEKHRLTKLGVQGAFNCLKNDSPFLSLLRKFGYSAVCGFRFDIEFSYYASIFEWEVFDRITFCKDLDVSWLKNAYAFGLGIPLTSYKDKEGNRNKMKAVIFNDMLDFGFGALSWSNPLIWDGCLTFPFTEIDTENQIIFLRQLGRDPEGEKKYNDLVWWSPPISTAIIFPTKPFQGFYVWRKAFVDTDGAKFLTDVCVITKEGIKLFCNDFELEGVDIVKI